MSSPANVTQQVESPLTVAQAQIAQSKWNTYQQDFIPVENQYMGQVNAMNSPSQYGQAGGLAQGQTVAAQQPVLNQASAKLIGSGAAPGSGAYDANMANLQTGQAIQQAQATLTAEEGQQDRYRGGLESVVGMGNGQSMGAQASISSLANQATNAALANQGMYYGGQVAQAQGLGQIGGALANAGLSAALK